MTKTFIPFLYKIGKTFVFRRTKKVEDVISTRCIIFYRIDFFSYIKIDQVFDNEVFSIKQINSICQTVVRDLGATFLD